MSTVTLRDLQARRLNAGRSLSDLAHELGISDETLRRIELGKQTSPRPQTKKAIADYLGCTVTDLWPIEQEA